MKHTGIVRRVDELGRFVIPAELRRTQGMRPCDRGTDGYGGAAVIYAIIALLGVGCAYLGLGLLVDRLLLQPMERRWRR